MKESDRFVVSYYNPETLARESGGVFGLIDNRYHHTPFIPVTLDNGLVNPVFLDFALNVQSFRCECDRGSASFRCENRATKKGNKQYWYAYKKVDGKTRRFNIGDLTKLDFAAIEEAVAVINGLKAAHKKSVTVMHFRVNDAQTKKNYSRDGDRIDSSVPEEIPPDWNPEAEQWKRIAATYESSCDMAWDKVAELKAEIETLKAIATPSLELAGHGKYENHIQTNLLDCRQLLSIREKELYSTQEKLLTYVDEIEALKQERNIALSDLKKLDRNYDALQERCTGLRELHHEALQRIFQLETEASKREDDVAGYAYMYDEHSNRIFAYQSLIEQYRSYAHGKTKKANPRYAYLIDFLADIDKLF